MNKVRWMFAGGAFLLAFGVHGQRRAGKITNFITGKSAFVDAKDVKPGMFRKITANDLPKPYATGSASNTELAARPAGALPASARWIQGRAVPGKSEAAAPDSHRSQRRFLRHRDQRRRNQGDSRPEAPTASRSKWRPSPPARRARSESTSIRPGRILSGSTLATPLRWSASRIRTAIMKATGPAQTIIPELPSGGHSTRDVVFSKDGKSMLVAVGSGSNVDDPDTHPSETHRANILEYTPEGKFVASTPPESAIRWDSA